MSLKLVLPRDPLIFRDGKPFTAVPGERSKSLLFPYPATLAGAVRTRTGTNSGRSEFKKTKDELDKLKQLSVRGPVLVKLEADGTIKQWFFPAPADALLIKNANVTTRYFLSPLDVDETRKSNLEGGLALVGAGKNIQEKPMNQPPLYWTWEMIQKWLENPGDGAVDLDTLGIRGPERETRTHVSIAPETQAAVSGALFQTSGMEFMQVKHKKDERPVLSSSRQLALALETTATFESGVDFLGGERRVVRWENVDGKLPECPPKIKEGIKKDGHCRLVLATPASFDEGFIPAKYKERVRAVALPRYQTISGWDYEKKRPKPTRRLTPAGTVYFLDLKNMDIDKFIEDVWLKPISDDEQSCADGFGLALLGAWDGSKRKMNLEVKDE